MPACSRKSTTCNSGAGGFAYSYKPAPRISTPFTSSDRPMKNQIETERPSLIIHLPRSHLPENDVENHKNNGHNRCPEKRLLIQRHVSQGRYLCLSVYQPAQ